MEQPLFDIIFKGETLEGVDAFTAQQNLAALFKQPVEKIANQFFSQPCYLKKSLSKENAAKYQTVLRKAGVKIYIKEQKPKPASTEEPQANSADNELTTSNNSAETSSQTTPEEKYGLSLAPMEGELLKKSEKKVSIVNEMDLSAYSLAAQEGYLVDPTELPPREYPLIEIPDLHLVPMED